jgi:hypothetical protein
MISCAIPDEHRLDVRLQRPRQLREKEIDDAGVQTLRDQHLGLTRLGARRSQHADEPVLSLADGTRSRTGNSWGPYHSMSEFVNPCTYRVTATNGSFGVIEFPALSIDV